MHIFSSLWARQVLISKKKFCFNEYQACNNTIDPNHDSDFGELALGMNMRFQGSGSGVFPV